MRCLIVLLVLSIAARGYGASGDRVIKDLAPPPPGTTLPVVINRTLKARSLPGEPITARLIQSVPVSTDVILPREATLKGHIVNVSGSSISILFDHLSWKGRPSPFMSGLLQLPT
jgi:hypothetical protein